MVEPLTTVCSLNDCKKRLGLHRRNRDRSLLRGKGEEDDVECETGSHCPKSFEDQRAEATGGLLQLDATQVHRHEDKFQAEFMDSLWTADEEFIKAVNEDDTKLWTASVESAKVFTDAKKTNREMRKHLGGQTFHKHILPNIPEASDAEKKRREKIIKDFEDAGLESYSFKDEHSDIMTDVNSQGGCGSCYAVAASDAFTLRLRAKCKSENQANCRNIDVAPQGVLDCSFTNQGCEGGFPI